VSGVINPDIILSNLLSLFGTINIDPVLNLSNLFILNKSPPSSDLIENTKVARKDGF